MKIKLVYLVLFTFCSSSCSTLLNTSSKKQQTGRVLMYGTQYPLSVNIDIYQGTEKISSTQSDVEGFFQFSIPTKNRKEITFIISKSALPDTIYNVNGYKKLLFKCNSNETINISDTSLNDTITLISKKCNLLIIENLQPDISH